VGVNEFIEKDEVVDIPILTVSPEVERTQRERLANIKANRSGVEVENSLLEIKNAAEKGNNLMPVFVKAAANYVTLGEMIDVLKEPFGIYTEEAVF
jgi:methylmalonyl-CoA mutase N-terminal domain/subunit